MRKILLNKIVVPRWIIFSLDMVIIGFAFGFSYFIVKFFLVKEIAKTDFLMYTALYCVLTGFVFYCMRIHTGLIRYSNFEDMLRIFAALLFSSLIYPPAVLLLQNVVNGMQPLNQLKILFINFFTASSLLVFVRVTIKGMYSLLKQFSSNKVDKVLIYGTELTSILIKQTLESTRENKLQIVGFIDSHPNKVNKYIQQVKVYPPSFLQKLHARWKIDKLILPNDQLASKEMKELVDLCLELSIRVFTVPPSDQWIYGRLCLTQIKDLKIEDLLQREPIVINNQKVYHELSGKCILVTGAAGSIGAEISRQVMKYDPACVVLCDQAESSLHEFQLEMEEQFDKAKVKTFLGNIQSHERMDFLFKKYRPDVVFHAAAYKHVPMMEHHPCEAVLTNVLGTKNLADMAVLYETEKFVMISSDKAVNPTNVMGTSKRIAEKYVQSLHDSQEITRGIQLESFKTKFITTRFGNVLGSNGSVIPRFYKQIQNGGPVTVTDPDITRYFMTIPEAVQLVLEACTMGHGGEIFVFDMGQPVKIVDMARKMIKLAGLVPEKDIKIQFTGLRPGEKLYEEVLSDAERTIPTYHDKIRIAKVAKTSYYDMLKHVLDLVECCDHDDAYQIVRKMKQIVPEFQSKNSAYEILDIKPGRDKETMLISVKA